MLWFNFIFGFIFSNQFIFFKLVYLFQAGSFFFKLAHFFFQLVYFFKTVIFIEDIKQDHYLEVRTDVTFKTLNIDFQWLAFIYM